MRRTAQLGLISLTALGIGLAALAAAPGAAAQGQEPLCRRPAALPPLPPEPQVRDPQQRRYRGGVLAAPVMAEPMAPPPMPSPPPPPPPPPMAPEPMSPEASADEAIAVTGSASAPPAPVASMPPSDDRIGEARMAPSLHRPRPQPQSGLLTAGDHDDLLNPELYASYAGYFLQRSNLRADLPRLDTRRVLTVAVQDEAGRPVPFARVTVHCGDGNSLSLATVADGTAVFYPGLDRLGSRVRVAVPGGAARTIELGGPGAQRQGFTIRSGAVPVRKFDLMLAIDTTGSMGDEIAYLKSELRAILADLRRAHPGLDIRLGLVAYRDLGDIYVTRTYPFTADLESMQANLSAQYADGGGDYPEAMDLAMARAVQQDWRPDAVKSLLLVADAPPHDENIGKTWRAAEAARGKRIQIVPVAASGVGDTAEYVMRAMAAATQSRYIFLTDDSGIGNPHATPAVDCFLVTRLDRLVRRVLDSQISGRRVEPREGEVIRSVGRYDNGKCVLPPDYPVPEQY